MGSRSAQRLDVTSAAPVADDSCADDSRIVERIRAGDQAAFAELVLAYTRPLRTFIQGFVQSPQAAEELVQDLFLKIWRMGSELPVQSNLRAYLYMAARNSALVYCRHSRVTERWATAAAKSPELAAMGMPARPADRRAELAELDAEVRRAIDRLPERCRQAATLRFQHDLSYTEIASVMGVTIKAVERQVTRALKKLRTDLADYFER